MIEQTKFIRANILEINAPKFTLEKYKEGIVLFGSVTNLRTFMSADFYQFISEEKNRILLVYEFEKLLFVRSKIVDIANRYFYHKSDVEKFFNSQIQLEVVNNISSVDFTDTILNYIEENTHPVSKFKFVKSSLKTVIEKQKHFLSSNGFPTNLLQINSGIMTANAGDSAQFLFLARAILAGYNCSNVDVRSSRYDAVIDYENTLLRIQIKGVSGSSISFKDRDRGGQGIDHKHERNVGQRITSDDCDIYVAVDKEVGLCYLIPMKLEIDPRKDEEVKAISLKKFENYKECWDIIRIVANEKSIK